MGAATLAEAMCALVDDRLVEGGACRIIHGIATLRPDVACAAPGYQTTRLNDLNTPEYA